MASTLSFGIYNIFTGNNLRSQSFMLYLFKPSDRKEKLPLSRLFLKMTQRFITFSYFKNT